MKSGGGAASALDASRAMHPGHARSPKCVGKRPKGVQRSERLRKYLNARAEGGRFEPGQRPARVNVVSALKSLCCKDSGPCEVDAAASRKYPKEPYFTLPNRNGSGLPQLH